jgi:hypothetical protein
MNCVAVAVRFDGRWAPFSRAKGALNSGVLKSG